MCPFFYDRRQARVARLPHLGVAVRFYMEAQNHRRRTEGVASRGTLIYLRRRAWRYVRALGIALPRLYAIAYARSLLRPRITNGLMSWESGPMPQRARPWTSRRPHAAAIYPTCFRRFVP